MIMDFKTSIPEPERKSLRSKSDLSKRELSICYHKCEVKSDTEPKRCRKNGCKNFIANACYLSSHSCESCVCACLLLCSTKTNVTSINAEVAVVDPSESSLIQEESPLPHDGDHLNNGQAVSMSSKKCDTSNGDEDAHSSNKQVLTTPFDAIHEDSTEDYNLNVGKADNDAEVNEEKDAATLGSDLIQEASPLPRDGDHLNEETVFMSCKKGDISNGDPIGCKQKLHSCNECKYPCEECNAALPYAYDTTNDHEKYVQGVLGLLMLPTVSNLQKSLDSDVLTSSITAETTYDGASMYEYVLDDDITVLEKADNGSIVDNGDLICSNNNPNPTKNFKGLPFGDSSIIYDPIINSMEKINLFYADQYCYKCYRNTGDVHLKYCSLCDQQSFIGCRAEDEQLDEEFIPTGGPLFFCCYCHSLKRDFQMLVGDASLDNHEGLYRVGDTIALWGEHVIKYDSIARKLYERRMELGKTENEYSERLYGASIDHSSAELADSIIQNYLDGVEPRDFVCSICDENFVDNIEFESLNKNVCIECAMENFYGTLDIEMKRDKRLIMNKRKYNLGFYPASQNFLQLPYHHKIDSEDKLFNEELTYRGAMTKEDLMNFYFNNEFKGEKEECCSFVFRTDKSLKKSSQIQAYFIFDNTYSNPKSKGEFIDVYVQVIVPLKRKIAMLFYRNPGISVYKLLLVPIVQYADMVKVGVMVSNEGISYDSKAYQNRIMELHTSGIPNPTMVNEISSMYDDWIDDGKVIGCCPRRRFYVYNDYCRITAFVGCSYVAKVFRNGDLVHLFWEEMSTSDFGELGFESLDAETFEKLFKFRMLQYKPPANKTEEKKPSTTKFNKNKELITQSSSAIIGSNVSTPQVSSKNSSPSLASSKSKVSRANNTNAKSNDIDKIDCHHNLISQAMKGNESGAAVNGNDKNPGNYALEPIANDFNPAFAPVSLDNDLWVSKSFHTIDSFEFCFIVHSKKDKNVRLLNIGDLHPGRGYFACCGYHVDDPAQMRLFFSNEQFNKVTSIQLKNYLKLDWSPTQKLHLQVKPNPILSESLFNAMKLFATTMKAESRRSGIQISYPDSRKHLMRLVDKAPDTIVTKKTPLKRNNSAGSSTISTSKTSSKTKESTQSSLLKAPRKRKIGNIIDKIEVEVLEPSSDNEAAIYKGKKRSLMKVDTRACLSKTKDVSESLDKHQNDTGNQAGLILMLMDQIRILQEGNAKRDKMLEDALNKRADDAREIEEEKRKREQKAQREIEEEKKKRELREIEEEKKKREQREIEEEKRKKKREQKEIEEEKKKREQREIEEEKKKREQGEIEEEERKIKEKELREIEEAQRKREATIAESLNNLLRATAELEKKRELEETERKEKIEDIERRYQLLLDAESKKHAEFMASRLQSLEEEVEGKKFVESERQRNEVLRERVLLLQEQQRLSEHADLAILAKRQALLADDFLRKKEEYEQSQKQKSDKEKEERDQKLSQAEKELSLNERMFNLEEKRKSADEKRKAAEHQRTQESRRY